MRWPRFLLIHLPAAILFSSAALGIYLLIAGLLLGRANGGLWDFYKQLFVDELQSSVLVYFAILSATTVYLKYFRSGLPGPSVDSKKDELVDREPVAASSGNNGNLRRIPVKENGKIVLVDAELIDWVESYGNYVFLHTAERKFIYRETMAAMERKLDREQFIRIRRSAIVKVDRIKELHPTDNGEFEIVLANDSVLVSTRRYRKNLESVLKT
jgi:DNA-binding LytR/AlgR family response regulator